MIVGGEGAWKGLFLIIYKAERGQPQFTRETATLFLGRHEEAKLLS